MNGEAKIYSETKREEEFYIEEASLANVSEIKRLMTQQAEHHGYVYKGNTAVILYSLAGKNPVTRSFLVYKPGETKAICCAMYSLIWTAEGKKVYLEDICVDSSYRSGGVGKFAVDEVCRRALEMGADALHGAVANNNTNTMVFWLKGSGKPLGKRTYGLTNLFSNSSAIDGPYAFKAEEITSPESPAVPAELQEAAPDPHTGVIVVYDESSNQPVAMTLANAKFTAGSSKAPGIAMEPVKFLKPLSDEDKKDVLKAAFSRAIYYAKQKGYADHFYALADKRCPISNAFIKQIGTGERQESSDPDSVLVCMQLPIAARKPNPSG